MKKTCFKGHEHTFDLFTNYNIKKSRSPFCRFYATKNHIFPILAAQILRCPYILRECITKLCYQITVFSQFGNTNSATRSPNQPILINLYKKHDTKKNFFQLLVALFRNFEVSSLKKPASKENFRIYKG
jgi:hypothetical protein